MPARRSEETFEERAARRLLGERIQGLREERHLTQEDLVERAGLDRSHLAKIEAGRINPSLLTLTRIAHGLGVTIAELFSDPKW